MLSLVVLNSRGTKPLLNYLRERFGVELSTSYAFFKSHKGRIYLITRDIERVSFSTLPIISLGFYFCTEEKDGYRLSFDGALFIANLVKRNVITLENNQMELWMRGENFPYTYGDGYVLVKYGEDCVGCGKVKDNTMVNFVPKSRRVKLLN